jgi:hypothetical protein
MIDKNIETKKLGGWFQHQLHNYKNNKDLMKNENIRKLWEEFIDKYKEYFLTNTEIWFKTLNNLEKYFIEFKKRPSTNIKIGNWCSIQLQNYKKFEDIMKNEIIRIQWKEFVEKYKEYFLSNEENWVKILNNVENYITENKIKPSIKSEDIETKKSGLWINTQIQNYKNNEHIMTNENIKKQWEKFIEKHKKYFLSNEENWVKTLNEVENYIAEKNIKPSLNSKNNTVKSFGRWVQTQKNNYRKNTHKMSNEIFRKQWDFFIDKYKNFI